MRFAQCHGRTEDVVVVIHGFPRCQSDPHSQRGSGGSKRAFVEASVTASEHRSASVTSSKEARKPSPVCLTSRPPPSDKCPTDDEVVLPEKRHELRLARRSSKIVEPWRSVNKIYRAEWTRQLRVVDRFMNPTEEAQDIVLRDTDDLRGHQPVRRSMDRLHSVGRRCVGEAERGAIPRVEPATDELDAVLGRQLEIGDVCCGHILGGGAGDIVAIHDERP